jgi:hypothetical protein
VLSDNDRAPYFKLQNADKVRYEAEKEVMNAGYNAQKKVTLAHT